MRGREEIVSNLEAVYREEYERADEADERDEMARLDFQFRRDQLLLEALLDVRGLLARVVATTEEEGETTDASSLLEKAAALRKITRLR